MNYIEYREAICRVGRLLYERGYVAANDGNISLRLPDGSILITPSGVSKGRLEPDMLLITDTDGNVLSGRLHPTSEGKMHYTVYRRRADVGAVVHAHPPVATAFAICRRGLDTPYLAETVVGFGSVPVTESFAMLSTDEVPRSVEPYLPDHNALLLANHGAVAWGEDLWTAFDRLEVVEHTAKIFLNVSLLGGGVPLTEEECARLCSLRGMYAALKQERSDGKEQA